MIVRAHWKPGPAAGAPAPYVVSVTEFRADRLRDVRAIWCAGLELRESWPDRPGAIGLWLWAAVPGRRSGSVSIWDSREALRGFVVWAAHVAIVRAFRDRGTMRAITWETDRTTSGGAWHEAERRLLRQPA